MAKVSVMSEPVSPPPPPMAQAGTFPGDPTVYVRLLSGAALHLCRVKADKQRQIVVDGRPCEHVETAPDGRWVYQMRAS